MSVHSNLKYVDVFRNPKWLLDNLLGRYKVILYAPTGWVASNAGSGSFGAGPDSVIVRTGTTANSRGMGIAFPVALNSGDMDYRYVDWRKYLEINTIIFRSASDPEVIARLQLKETSTEGALTGRGVGVEIRNYAMYGESYGTSRGTVAIGVLSDRRAVKLTIVKRMDRVEFYVNNVLQGSLEGAYVPADIGTAYLVISIVNGATGGVDALFGATPPLIIQEW
jgi:hypothetical protein